MKIIIDAATSGDLSKIPYNILLGIGFMIIEFLISYIMGILRSKFLQKCSYSLKQDMFTKIIHSDINKFNASNSAKYISILNNDIKLVEQDYFRNIPDIISSFSMLLLAIVSLFFLNPIVAVTAIFLSLFTFIVPTLTGKRITRCQEKYTKS